MAGDDNEVEIGRVAQEAARRLGLPAPDLVRAGTAAVFRSGDVAIRVEARGVATSSSVRVAHFLAAKGIPVARPVTDPIIIDGYPVTAWDWLEPLEEPIDAETLGRIVRRLHSVDLEELNTVIHLANWSELGVTDLADDLQQIADDSVISATGFDALSAAFERCRAWNTRTSSVQVVCHGDLHPHNVVMTSDGPRLIDLDTLCLAPACWDHAMLTTLDLWGGPKRFYQRFAVGYGQDLSVDQGCRDLAVMRLLSATVHLAQKARSSGRASKELSRRMRYWAGDPAAPYWSPI